MIHLTGQNYNAREIIQNIFSPLIGVITSPLADHVCQKNNLSFVELMQPFTKLPNDAHFRDVSGTGVSISGLRLNFCDVDWRPPQTVLARKMLNEAVSNAKNDKTKIVSSDSIDIVLPTSETWFEQWRETFLSVQFPADHEFTRHLLSCLIILTSNDPDIIETAEKLTQRVHQMQSITPQKLPKWFHPNDVLNSYVIIHEGCKGDLSKAQQSFELLKSIYGEGKCFLVQMNSLDIAVISEMPDYWELYIKTRTKLDAQADQLNISKTPQDAVSIIAMPSMSTTFDTEGDNDIDQPILHPLSPAQENATEAIHSDFSISTESIVSQTINPNLWNTDLAADEPHGGCLNAIDIENLRHFVQDYTIRVLIPYIEHLVAILNDAVTNKKGVSKSLLSATKRWFVTSKPGAGASNQNAVIYTQESVELQTRKLGDLYFMFGHYNLAFQAYHQAKRDFNADSAWQYYAGALEMAAVSAFMLGISNRKTYDYMEDAIMCYLTVCKLQQFATRATLLSMECLKATRLFGETAKQLIRMTSEESDLRSALLLEQAAYCFLALQPSMHRKYAFHIVLSGNRFSRAGQRNHAYRCYNQAYQVFLGRGWSLAEDHIQYTMAKQAYMLKKLIEASLAFARLLRPDSQQSMQQQASFLKEYIQIQNELIKRSQDLKLLPLAVPQVLHDSIRILTLASPPKVTPLYVSATNIDIKSNLSDEKIWIKIEEMIATIVAANKPVVFKPLRSLFSKETFSAEYPIAVQGESIEIAVTLLNTVRCSIKLEGIELLWKLKLENGQMLSNMYLYENIGESLNKASVNEHKNSCKQAYDEEFLRIIGRDKLEDGKPYIDNHLIILEENEEKTLFFKFTPSIPGFLSIIGLVAQVAAATEPDACLLGSLCFKTEILKTTVKQSVQKQSNNKLGIKIIPHVPLLNVSFSTLPADLVAGEIVPVTIILHNLGINSLEEIYLGCEKPRWITLFDTVAEIPLSFFSSAAKDMSNEKLVKDKVIRQQHVFRLLKPATVANGVLRSQETLTIPMWIQAPYRKGDSNANMKYRLVRHVWKFNIHECLHSEISCVVSNTLCGELGINVNLKNDNEMNHPIKTELYVNSLGLYCSKYKLNKDKIYLTNQMDITTGQLGDRCLKPSKSMSFQCRLKRVDSPLNTNSTVEQLLRARVSIMDVMPARDAKELQTYMPPLEEIYGFLMKQETVLFNIYISSEEFSYVVGSYDPHITIVLIWSAVVEQNSNQRIACGQHFLQLRSIYETVVCHDVVQCQYKAPICKELSESICEFTLKKKSNKFSDCGIETGQEDIWGYNDYILGRRCLLDE